MRTRTMRTLGMTLLFGALATPALAGGPNNIYDNLNKIPYVWKMEHWTGGAVPVFTDLGGLGLLTNAQANGWTVAAWDQWNTVPSSTFRAQVFGDVGVLGLGDITAANVAQVFFVPNGGGVTVVYDEDGDIFTNYLGIPSVLGIAFTEFAVPDTNELFEGTVFLNGDRMVFNDLDGTGFSGVFTHEFGHALNLRHTQANGAVQNQTTVDAPLPYGCTGPYPGSPGVGPNVQQVETMYPFLDQRITGTSRYMFTVDRMDDIQAISDLYPAPGWPESHGTVKGTVDFLTKILGNGTGPTQQISGVNMIARNIADPYNDFVSTTTGEYTRGEGPADGSYELHGLTPGATYVVYTDNILSGGFPVPRLITLPGPEEWWNGALESGNGETDNRCAWTGIPASAGSVTTADITFNRVKGAPIVTIPFALGNVTDITADGSLMVGVSEGSGSDEYFTWTGEGNPTFVTTGGAAHFGGNPSISDDGTKIAGQAYDASHVAHHGIWQNGAWTLLPPPPVNQGSCNGGQGPYWGTTWGLSGDGSTLVGQVYTRGCTTAGVRAAKWSPAAGWEILAKDPATPTQQSRAVAVSYDGSVISGFDNLFGFNRGVYWIGGVEHFIASNPQSFTGFFGQGIHISRDGQIIFGMQREDPSAGCVVGGICAAYLHYVSTGESESLHGNPAGYSAAFRGSDDGSVVLGFDQTFGQVVATVWTRQLGWYNLQQFLNAQGTYLQDVIPGNVGAVSTDGRVWGGYVRSINGLLPARFDVPKAIVCHKSPGNPNATPQNVDVTFPGGLDQHLAHGDTFGLCQIGVP